ncbi:hypothetical protein BDC45DRAFT_587123 [Circinella umbellata]|nr:hypothetical protein BDC45DRAFT_587123 [Circinella umbellata]
MYCIMIYDKDGYKLVIEEKPRLLTSQSSFVSVVPCSTHVVVVSASNNIAYCNLIVFSTALTRFKAEDDCTIIMGQSSTSVENNCHDVFYVQLRLEHLKNEYSHRFWYHDEKNSLTYYRIINKYYSNEPSSPSRLRGLNPFSPSWVEPLRIFVR